MNYVGDNNSVFHGTNSNSITEGLPAAYERYDLSLRRDSSLGRTFPNGLSDLTKRENRFLHNNAGNGTFPFESTFLGSLETAGPLGDTRVGEDVILSNVVSFDVRVFDPRATIEQVNGVAVIPGDPGWTGSGTTTGALGAYVDLGLGDGIFSGTPTTKSGLSTNTYDTWSTHYEFNGIDEDGAGVVDQGTDGIDNGGIVGIIDDAAEQETAPPYPYPLRGLEVRIRVYEPSSRQVRQVTVRHTFVPH
jgi:hypothetical protein